MKRFLRDLHRGHERDSQDKERAKAEVARLNGQASTGAGSGTAAGGGSHAEANNRGGVYKSAAPQSKPSIHFTEKQRQEQVRQLVELGVNVPDDMRADLAIPGEWTVTKERVIEDPEQENRVESLAVGVRRKREEEKEEENEEEKEVKKARWGQAVKTYGNAHGRDDLEDDGELDALLKQTISGVKDATSADLPTKIKTEPDKVKVEADEVASGTAVSSHEEVILKQESTSHSSEPFIKTEASPPTAPPDLGVVFKKRKAKNLRQK